MGSEIAVVERQLKPLMPRFDDLLRGSLMDSKAMVAGVMIAMERSKRLQECTPQSILNCVNTAAALRLPFDGASGQFFPLPFKNKGVMMAQPSVGYKGFNTIGARGGLAINAAVVREGDHEWDYQEGTGGFVRHKKKLDNQGRIIAAWSTGTANGRPHVVSVMGIGEIEEIMKRSPAFRSGADTPWKDKAIGFVAMCEKTPRRRLARSIPWEIDSGRYMLAARLEEAFDEQGKYGFIGHDGNLRVDDEGSSLAPREPSLTPTAEELTKPLELSGEPALAAIQKDGVVAANEGMKGLEIWFGDLPSSVKKKIKDFLDTRLKPIAQMVDKKKSAPVVIDGEFEEAPHDAAISRQEIEADFLPFKMAELKAQPDRASTEALRDAVLPALKAYPDLMQQFSAAVDEHLQAVS